MVCSELFFVWIMQPEEGPINTNADKTTIKIQSSPAMKKIIPSQASKMAKVQLDNKNSKNTANKTEKVSDKGPRKTTLMGLAITCKQFNTVKILYWKVCDVLAVVVGLSGDWVPYILLIYSIPQTPNM